MLGFSLSQDEYDAARELVSGASGPSPIALEFEEFGQEEDLGLARRLWQRAPYTVV